MKSIILKSVFFATIILFSASGVIGQRVIKGIVYKGGQPAAGINVEAHRGGAMMTSFDGKYQVDADASSKWIKFTDIGTEEVKRYDLAPGAGDEVDFYFDNVKPVVNEQLASGANLKSLDELKKEQDMDALSEYSLYLGFYEQNDYKSAYPHWEKLYSSYPKITPNIYISGSVINEDQFNKAKTWAEKEKLIQKSVEICDKRIKYFGREGYVLGRKANSWLDFYRQNDEELSLEKRKEVLKKGYEWLSQSVKLQGVDSEPPILVLLIQTSSTLFKMGELPKETVVLNYDLCSKLINDIQAKAGADKIENVKLSVSAIEQIFGTSGAADCEALINIYTPQYKEKSGDIDFIKAMLRRLSNANCDESELFSSATEKLYELDPSAEAAYNMARRFLKREDIEKAKQYYKQAMEQGTDQELMKKCYYEYGMIIYAKDNALQEARNYANKALAIDPNYCKALILIGDIYVAASHTFGSDDFDKSTVFWVAIDYFNKAARAGEDCIAEASQKAAEFKKYYPNKEEAFFKGVNEGENFKVGGWINENTKVRF